MDPVKKLSNIIDLALSENSVDKLEEYLSSLQNSSDYLNGKLILVLTQILKKNGKHEEKTLHVSCVLTCLQHFASTVTEPKKWEKVSVGISKLCQLVFVIASSFIKEDSLIQRVVNVISALVDSVNNVVDNLSKFLIKSLLASSLCTTHSKYTRLLIMILIGFLLQKSSRGIRTEILPSTIDLLNDLSNFLRECDDYETQVSVVEILARSLRFIEQKHHKSVFTLNPEFGEMFQKHQPFHNFDPDCRLFLNEVNSSLGDQKKVFSMPCMVVCADDARLKKPNDPAYSDFWVDFNLGSRSISFYYQLSNSESWELMTISQDKVISAIAKDSACQSRNGQKFEAVKFELTIDSSDQSPNSELPQKLKIYPKKNQFTPVEPIIRQIFSEKYETEVVHREKSTEQMPREELHKDDHKQNGTCEGVSYIETSTLSKIPGDEGGEGKEAVDRSGVGSSQVSEESDAEESEENEGSPYSKFIKMKMLEEDKKNIVANSSRKDEENKTKNDLDENKVKLNTTRESILPDNEKKSLQEDICSKLDQIVDGSTNVNTCEKSTKSSTKEDRCSFVKLLDTNLEGGKGAKQLNLSANNSVSESNCKKRENTSEFNSNSKKKRLYCFEKSNAEDVVLSSQDQILSVEIPSYKLKKKETYVKPQRSSNRKNISFSYITNKEKEKSAIYSKHEQQKQSNFVDAIVTEKSPYDESSDSEGSESSPHQLFKDPPTKPKISSKIPPNNKKFFTNKYKKEVELHKNPESPQKKDRSKSAYSNFGSPAKFERLKCNNTYSRTKPKKPWKRLRVTPIESSDSDSQYTPPSKMLKENNKQISNISPKKTRFAARIVRDKIDPVRDNVFTHEMELEAANDFEVPVIKPREIIEKSLLTQGEGARKTSVTVVQSKNTGAVKKKATRQTNKLTNNKDKKKPEPKKSKQVILEKLSDGLTASMDVVQFEQPEGDSPLDCEDLALGILSCTEDQQRALLLHTTFKVNDMVRFGKLLMKQVQDKLQKAEKLALKEREMNLATFDYKVQASCNELYGNSQKMDSVTDKLEKLNTMLQATYKLHKDIAAQINTQASEVEAAKNELVKNINKIEKSESSSISSIFQGFGGYLKKLVLSFIQGNSTKSLTN